MIEAGKRTVAKPGGSVVEYTGGSPGVSLSAGLRGKEDATALRLAREEGMLPAHPPMSSPLKIGGTAWPGGDRRYRDVRHRVKYFETYRGLL